MLEQLDMELKLSHMATKISSKVPETIKMCYHENLLKQKYANETRMR